MTITQAIIQRLEVLPDSAQKQVLEFINSLQSIDDGFSYLDSDDEGWSRLSLESAMRGMEDEPSPYSMDDIKEYFG